MTTFLTIAGTLVAIALTLETARTAIRVSRDPFARYGVRYVLRDLRAMLVRGIR